MKLLSSLLAVFILSSYALAFNLSGENGKAVLGGLQNASNKIDTIAPGDLWSWGTAPVGHAVQNNSLIEAFNILNVGEDNGTMETPSQEMGLNYAVESGAISSEAAQSSGAQNSEAMQYYDRNSFGASASGTFDCTCYKTNNAAQFTESGESKAW